MMTRSVRSFAILAALAGIVLLSTPSPVRASISLSVAEPGVNAGNYTSLVLTPGIGGLTGSPSPFPGQSGTFSGQYGDFLIVFNSLQGTQSLTGGVATLATSVTSITNNGLVTVGTHTLHIDMSSTNFTSPTTGTLASHIGSTAPLVAGSANLLTFQSWANGTNAAAPATGLSFPGADRAGATPGAQVINITGAGSFASDAAIGVSGLATPYSLVQGIDLTLGTGATFNYSASTTITPVPEPATIAMALSGLPVLGLIWARRRRQKAV